MRFSANTGFLWKELPFLERIARAASAGFHALEFHDEAQGEESGALSDALGQAGLQVLGLNTRMGEPVGCAAIPGAGDQARRDFDAALALAERVDAAAIHVTAGKTAEPGARDAYLAHLDWAGQQTTHTLLIEPICRAAMPGYFLHIVGHVQIASAPERAEPDVGDLDYASLLPALIAEGYDGAFGCEYRARGPVEDGLGWLRAWS